MNKIEAVEEALEQWKDIVKYKLTEKPENTFHRMNNCALCEYVWQQMKKEDPPRKFEYWDKDIGEFKYPKLDCAKYCPVGKYWLTEYTEDKQYFCEHGSSPYAKFCEDIDDVSSGIYAQEVVDLLEDTLNKLEENNE